MRRRLSLTLLTVLAALVIGVSLRYLAPRRSDRRGAVGVARDSLAQSDSAARAAARAEADTMCFAARIGLPCDPR
jgi:hypothetical protein